MLRSVCLLAFVACCLAAPADDIRRDDKLPSGLTRPAPINPDIPSDPKPKDRVTLIENPAEIAKHRRDAGDYPNNNQNKPQTLPGPISLPDNSKTDSTYGKDQGHNHKREASTSPAPQTAASNNAKSPQSSDRRPYVPSGQAGKQKREDKPKPQTLPASGQSSRPANSGSQPQTLPASKQKREDKPKPQTLPASGQSSRPANSGSQPQTLPASKQKRDDKSQPQRPKGDTKPQTPSAPKQKRDNQPQPQTLPTLGQNSRPQNLPSNNGAQIQTVPASKQKRDDKPQPQTLPAPVPGNNNQRNKRDTQVPANSGNKPKSGTSQVQKKDQKSNTNSNSKPKRDTSYGGDSSNPTAVKPVPVAELFNKSQDKKDTTTDGYRKP